MAPIASSSTIVLITGANQGIGFQTSKKLASENKGYHVLMGSRDHAKGTKAAEELQALGLSVEPIEIDITSDASITKAAELIKEKYGRIDVLINNAGIGGSAPAEGESWRASFAQVYDTNVTSHAVVTDTFIPLLEKSTGVSRIVFVSSNLASLGLKADPTSQFSKLEAPSYRCSKTAVNMLMLIYAGRYEERGWKINAVCPGYVATNINAYRGYGTVEDGAINPCKLATLGKDGPNGTFTEKEGTLSW